MIVPVPVSAARLADANPSSLPETPPAEKCASAARATEVQETKVDFRSIVEGLSEGILITDAEDVVLYMNPQLSKMTGFTDTEMLGRPAYKFLLPPEEWPDLAERNHSRAGGVSEDWETRLLRKDGTRFWVKIGASPFRDADGRIVGTLGVLTDITERKQVEEDQCASRGVIERNNSLLLAQKEASLDGILVVDENRCITSYNQRLCELWNTPLEIIQSGDDKKHLAYALSLLKNPEEFLQRVMYLYEHPTEHSRDEVEMKDGRTIDRYSAPVVSASGEDFGRIWHFRDITERKRTEQQREALLLDALQRAEQDPLTGLWNHRAFHRRLEQEANRTRREGSTLAVVMLDLDNFKFFNDVYGHAVGDGVLRQVAERLKQICRSYDTAARFGGDEFALLLPGIGSATEAEIAMRLRADLDGLVSCPNGNDAIPINLSVGVALLSDTGTDYHETLRQADERLLRSKTGGGAEVEADRVRAHAERSLEGFLMLDALVVAVDNKDRYTRRHSEDVMEYSLAIARELGLDEASLQTIGVAALLHDVGKIGVPDAVLRKPGRLTEQEFEAIKQHPMMGAVIVGAVPGLENVLDAVRHHHERWDGAGYPFGLCGAEIPLMARLMAVADAFSAMTTDRPYRAGMSESRALSILEAGSETQWDPDCIRAFLQIRCRPAAQAACHTEPVSELGFSCRSEPEISEPEI